MKFTPVPSLPGLWMVDLEQRRDERGYLARTYCETEFASHGLNTHWPQCNLTVTHRRGMLRGLHFQAEPRPEIKLVRCAAGAIYDIVVDLRPGSPAFGRWQGFELTADTGRALYVPAGFAHGFQCLADDCQVFYYMSESYDPALARGVCWNDPQVGAVWPLSEPVVSARDLALPPLDALCEIELTRYAP